MLLTLDTPRYERTVHLSYLKTETILINVPIYKHVVITTLYSLLNLILTVYKNPSGPLNKDRENYVNSYT